MFLLSGNAYGWVGKGRITDLLTNVLKRLIQFDQLTETVFNNCVGPLVHFTVLICSATNSCFNTLQNVHTKVFLITKM